MARLALALLGLLGLGSKGSGVAMVLGGGFGSADMLDPHQLAMPLRGGGDSVPLGGAVHVHVLHSVSCAHGVAPALAVDRALMAAGSDPDLTVMVTRLVPEHCGDGAGQAAGRSLLEGTASLFESRAWHHPAYTPLSPFYGDRLHARLDPALEFLYGVMHFLQFDPRREHDEPVWLAGPGPDSSAFVLRRITADDVVEPGHLRGRPLAVAHDAMWARDPAVTEYLLRVHCTPLYPSVRPDGVRLPVLIAKSDLVRVAHQWLTLCEDMLANGATAALFAPADERGGAAPASLLNYAYALASSSVGLVNRPWPAAAVVALGDVDPVDGTPPSSALPLFAVLDSGLASALPPPFMSPTAALGRSPWPSCRSQSPRPDAASAGAEATRFPAPWLAVDAVRQANDGSPPGDCAEAWRQFTVVAVSWMLCRAHSAVIRQFNELCPRQRVQLADEVGPVRRLAMREEPPVAADSVGRACRLDRRWSAPSLVRAAARNTPLPGPAQPFQTASRPVDEVVLHMQQLSVMAEDDRTEAGHSADDSNDSEAGSDDVARERAVRLYKQLSGLDEATARGDLRRRVVVDDVLSAEECTTIVRAANASLVQGNMYPAYEKIFAGMGLADLHHVPLATKAVLMRARNRARYLTQRHFRLAQLYVDTSQITRRNALPADYTGPGLVDPDGRLAHGVHADNCGHVEPGLRNPATGLPECVRHLGHCCYWRDFTTLLFLNGPDDAQFPVQGGQFFFVDPAPSAEPFDPYRANGPAGADDTAAGSGGGRRLQIAPRCGRLVAFSAGDENMHGVTAVTSGQRFSMAQWLTVAPNHRELLRNEQFFQQWYAGHWPEVTDQERQEDETQGRNLPVDELIAAVLGGAAAQAVPAPPSPKDEL